MAFLYAAKGGATGHRMKFSAHNVAKAGDLTPQFVRINFECGHTM